MKGSAVQTNSSNSGNNNNEPVEKKRKSDEEQPVSDQSSVAVANSEEIDLLSKRVAALMEECARLAAERDKILLQFTKMTEVKIFSALLLI